METNNQSAQDKELTAHESIPQPDTFTPGITKAMVRQHAYGLYRDKLTHEPLSLEDWVLAEKDLVQTLDTDNLVR
jgi:hypothetical protein